MQLLTYEEIYCYVHNTSKIVGTFGKKRVNGRLHLSKWRLLQSVISMSLSIALTMYYFTNSRYELTSEFARVKIINFLLVLRAVANVTILAILTALNYIYVEKTTAAIIELYKVDQKLLKLGQKEQLARANWRSRKSAIFLVLVVNIALNLTEGVLKALTKTDKQIIYFVVVTYPRIALSNLNTLFFVMTLILEERFRIINGLILKRKNESVSAGGYSKETNFCEAIDELISMHKSLVHVTKEINQIFYTNALFFVTADFILLVGDLYIIMYAVFSRFVQKHAKTIISLVKNCTSYVTDLFYFAKRSSDLCDEANRTQVLLAGIHISIDKEEERNTVITSILKLIHNKLDITGARLFSINNALLFSICGAASSYLFIMLQLDLGGGKVGDDSTNFTNSSLGN